MPFASQNLISHSSLPRISIRLNPSLQSPNSSLSIRPVTSIPQLSLQIHPFCISRTQLSSFVVRRAYGSSTIAAGERIRDLDFDSFLSFSELVCISSSAAVSTAFAVNCALFGWAAGFIGVVWRRILTAGVVALVVGVSLGAWIRRRQWRRVRVESTRGGDKSLNLVERLEKLEEDLKSSTTIIRVLSRQLEKLGVRFRVTRRTLKDPIAEAATLAQKTSEATGALAVQADILEKELGEIQNMLLAMQDQQQKQLELILAIGKSAKLWGSEEEHGRDQDTIRTSKNTDEAKRMEIHEAQPSGISNDRP